MKALIVVDIQNDFLPGGALAVEGGEQVIPIINELIASYDYVVATQDFHPEAHGSFAENHEGKEVGEVISLHGLEQVLWPAHCVQGTMGAEFASDLNLIGIDHIFPKGSDSDVDSYSGFYDNGHRNSTGLAEHLREKGVDEVHVVGVATDYCVKFTALDAVKEGFQTTLLVDACRGVNIADGDVEKAISEMEKAGVAITRSVEILGETMTLYRPVGAGELALLKNI